MEWYVAGPIIGAVFFLFLLLGKSFGISSAYRGICALVPGASKLEYFRLNQKDHFWRYSFILGLIIGGLIIHQYQHNLMIPDWMMIGDSYDWNSLWILIPGGLFIGFGTRYAGGCTSGHAITGLSFLQWRSLVAVIGFFIGGLLITQLLNLYL